MIEAANPEIDVEQLMARIREEVARRKQRLAPAAESLSPSLPNEPPTPVAPGLAELLRHDGAEFVTQAYRAFLRREPEPAAIEGRALTLESGGKAAKIDMLRELCASEEGRRAGAVVRGLTAPYSLGELLGGDDAEFVTQAYQALFGRAPDAEGLQTYLTCLREYALSRMDVLRALRFSEEGQALAVEVAGLQPLVSIQQSPLVDSLGQETEYRGAVEGGASIASHSLSALLGGDDAEFVAGAYRVLLGREPDEEGRRTYQEQLATGVMSRIDVLRALRFSPEGETFGIEVAGLTPLSGGRFPAIAMKGDYPLGELLGYPDEVFVRNAYQAILRREADPAGLQVYLGRLRQGSLSKIDILGGLRFSGEGRRVGVRVHGLLAPWLLHVAYRIPVLGSLMALVSVLLRPGKIIQRFRNLEAHSELADWQKRDVEQWRGEWDQLKRLVDAKVNRHEFTAIAARKINFEKFSTVTAWLETELRQLKVLADAKANSVELVEFEEMQARISQQLRINLRSALEGKADVSEISALHLRLKQALERIETRADQQAVAELENRLMETHALVDSRPEQQAITDLQGLIRVIAESKAEKSELTGLTNHLTDLMQAKAEAEAEALAELRQTLDAKVSHEALAELRQTLDAKASHEALAELRQTLDAKASVEQWVRELADIRRQIQAHQQSIVDQQRRLALLLEEARRRLPEPLDAGQLAVFSAEADHVLDAMYVSFEDGFRGTRTDIKQRLSAYLPSLPPGVGSSFAPAVDLGCGRGEWLELLKEHDLTATGVDLNRMMAESCRERGLMVIEADALAYLREQPDNSLGLITGFHIIEHLPLRTLVALFDEALRVLRPGGMVIFETPNPENLVVGACNFYMDPTHRNPMPPTMTQFLVEARGFVRVEIRRMNQQVLNDPLRLLDLRTPGAAELNPLIQMAKEHYFAAPDYAVIAYKA